jgi:hypothetical protein
MTTTPTSCVQHMEPVAAIVAAAEEGEKADAVAAIDEWTRLIDTLLVYARRGLVLLAPREMDGKPEKGVTELGLKLLLLGHLGNLPAEGVVVVESERELDGGRLDLCLIDERTQSVLVIELKYLRTSFLTLTPYSAKHTAKQQHAQWDTADKKVAALLAKHETWKEVCQVDYNRVQIGGCDGEQCNKATVVTLDTIRDEAVEQAVGYCGALRKGQIRPIGANMRLFYVVVIGVGRNIVASRVTEYVT